MESLLRSRSRFLLFLSLSMCCFFSFCHFWTALVSSSPCNCIVFLFLYWFCVFFCLLVSSFSLLWFSLCWFRLIFVSDSLRFTKSLCSRSLSLIILLVLSYVSLVFRYSCFSLFFLLLLALLFLFHLLFFVSVLSLPTANLASQLQALLLLCFFFFACFFLHLFLSCSFGVERSRVFVCGKASWSFSLFSLSFVFLHVRGWYLFCWICLSMKSASSIIFVFCFSLYLTRIAALYSSF